MILHWLPSSLKLQTLKIVGLLSMACLSTIDARAQDEEPQAVQVVEVEEQAIPFEEEELLFEVQAIQADPQAIFLYRYACAQAALARRACELSDAQEQQLKLLDPAWITEHMQAPNPAGNVIQGIARFLGGRPAAAQAQDPQTVIRNVRKVIDEYVIELLTEPQRKQFQEQLEARDRFYNQQVARVLVAALDDRLFLDAEQRSQLSEELAQWLGKRSGLYWQFYFQNQGYIPDFPNQILRKHLSKSQLAAMNNLQKWNYESEQMEWQIVGQQDGIAIIDH